MLLEIWLGIFAFAVICSITSMYFSRPGEWYVIAPLMSFLAAILFFALALSAVWIEIPVGEHVWNTTAVTWNTHTVTYTDTDVMYIFFAIGMFFIGWTGILLTIRPFDDLLMKWKEARRGLR